MCPFCVAALAVVAAKTIAATGGGAIVTNVVVSKLRKADSAAKTPEEDHAIARN